MQLRLTGKGRKSNLQSVPLLACALVEDSLKTSSWSTDVLAKELVKRGFENFERDANTVGSNQTAKAADNQSFRDLLRVTGQHKEEQQASG